MLVVDGRTTLIDIVAPAVPAETRNWVITPLPGTRYGALVCHASWFGPPHPLLVAVVWPRSVAASAGDASAAAATAAHPAAMVRRIMVVAFRRRWAAEA